MSEAQCMWCVSKNLSGSSQFDSKSLADQSTLSQGGTSQLQGHHSHSGEEGALERSGGMLLGSKGTPSITGQGCETCCNGESVDGFEEGTCVTMES